MNRRQYEAAMLYFKVLELAAIGGTDYTNALTTTLIDDATELAKTMDPFQRRIARLNIQRNNAIAAGASIPAGISGVNELTACCFQALNNDFEAIEILLDCALGVHKAYPQ